MGDLDKFKTVRDVYRTAVLPSRGWWALAASTVILLGTSPNLRAELMEVRQMASGMECPECARGLQILVKQIEGVDTATTSWNRRTLTVHFRSGNHATLSQIRALVVRQHFEVREAEAVIAGRLRVDASGRAYLTVPESGLTYRIDPGAKLVIEWIRALGSPATTGVVVTGRVPAGSGDDQAGDPLILWALEIRAATPDAAGGSSGGRES